MCWEERQKHKLANINQVHLFKRTCAGTGKTIITKYPPENPYKVYDVAYFRGDDRDPHVYGRDIDFTRPFFEQFRELDLAAPHPALFKDYMRDVNSDYTNYAGQNKNCYLIFDADENEEVMYAYGTNGSKQSADCYRCTNLEYCYEMIDAHNCYGSAFLQSSDNCNSCYFGFQLTNCDHCIMCSNLVNASYQYQNKPITKEQYEEIVECFQSYEDLEKTHIAFNEFIQQFPRPATVKYRTQNVVGNCIVDSKNTSLAFDSMNVET